MGCDIHTYVEFANPPTEDKLWRDLARPVLIRTSYHWTDEQSLLRALATPINTVEEGVDHG